MEKPEYPTLEIGIEKLQSLLSEKLTRKQVAMYGSYWLQEDTKSLKLKPQEVEIVSLLSSVDIPTTDREYLYTEEDFKKWIGKFEALIKEK